MPLPDSPHRTEVHLRRIEMRGYRRDDGMYEIDGRVTDIKARDLVTMDGTRFPATGRSTTCGCASWSTTRSSCTM